MQSITQKIFGLTIGFIALPILIFAIAGASQTGSPRQEAVPTTSIYLPLVVSQSIDQPMPTPTPTATSSSSGTATGTPTASATSTPTATPSQATATVTSTSTPTPTATDTATSTPTATATVASIPPDDLSNEQSIADLINQQRTANSLPSLTLVSELTQAARRHSRDMADNDFESHTGSDGTDGGQRISAAGYEWSTWGEIIGWGFGGDTASMLNWWMNSPDHRPTILSNSYDDFGVGYAINAGSEWGHYWTVNFGKRATAQTRASQDVYVCTYVSQGEKGGSMLIVHSTAPCHYNQ